VIVWRDVFLGVIAVATLAIAIAQIAVILAAGRAAKRLGDIAEEFQREVKPLVANLNAVGRDAARAAQLATAQVERADRLFADVVVRFEQTLNSVQETVTGPAKEGRALLSAFRAAFQAIRELRRDGAGRKGRGDEEDALFI
jgi:archaellum biogenesis protein FlaJ (TadC family)